MRIKIRWKDQNVIPAEIRFDCDTCDALVSRNLTCPILTLYDDEKKVIANIPMENILYYTVQY
jgi:hypothetical protein